MNEMMGFDYFFLFSFSFCFIFFIALMYLYFYRLLCFLCCMSNTNSVWMDCVCVCVCACVCAACVRVCVCLFRLRDRIYCARWRSGSRHPVMFNGSKTTFSLCFRRPPSVRSDLPRSIRALRSQPLSIPALCLTVLVAKRRKRCNRQCTKTSGP